MQIPDVTRPNEGEISNQARQPEGVEGGQAPDSPTVVRSSSGSSRRTRAAAPPPPPVALPRPGEAVGTFLLEEAIGVGGMGAVFRAHDAQLDREVALKLLPPDQAADPEVIQRFYQEGRAAARLDHENIARVYSIGQDGPHHFIVFEFIDGITVRRRVDEHGPLPVGEAVDTTLQVAQALVHAAGRGVVHRDIKPSNIILTPHGRAKVVDMGLARRFEREADHGLTQSGMTLGTFDYISPEQARDPRDVDVRSDLYSLGCTLFHMLTGRPPFPGGTVLQKLLQHQEEPPPDVRSLNPQVPAELARIINKLMAKDRDRRYQSPELLVRDLLALAGQLGFAVIESDPHAWTIGGHRPTWEYHQAWFFPALAFVLVVVGLFWWGRELTSPSPPEPGLEAFRSPRNETALGARVASPLAESTGAPASVGPDSDSPSQPPLSAKNLAARLGDDLLELIARAPKRAIITLVEDGTYMLGGRTGSLRAPSALVNRDVTIKAEPGTRPVLKLAADVHVGDRPPTAILPFVRGTVELEGLTFELEASGGQFAAVSAEDTDLTIRRCAFRQGSVRSGGNRTALLVRVRRMVGGAGDRPPAVFADSCHFDGWQVGILAEGPADLQLKDCTFGPASPAIKLANGQTQAPIPVEVDLRHASLMAGAGPVFEVEGSLARFRVDDCVVAAAESSRSSPPVLVAVDHARNLSWRGRSNLYSGIRPYLQSTRKGYEVQEIDGFAVWQDAAIDVREKGSRDVASSVWDTATPLQKLVIDQEDPTRAFELSPEYRSGPTFYGAHQGPHGTRLAGPVALAQGPPAGPQADEPRPGQADVGKVGDGVPSPAQSPGSTRDADRTARGAGDDDPTALPAMPPMVAPAAGDPVASATADDARFEASASNTSPRDRGDAAGQEEAARHDPAPNAEPGEGPIRTAEQFAAALGRLSGRGGLLKIARGADLELPATEFSGTGTLQIEAEAGPARPRIRLLNSAPPGRTSAPWSVLFHLRSGSLRLKGLDLVIRDQDQEAVRAGRVAAVGVSPGTEIVITDCTITAAGPFVNTAAIMAPPAVLDPGAPGAGASDQGSSVQINDSFLRSAGDCLFVGPGFQLGLRLQNVLAGCEGSLLHALGSSPAERSKIRLTLAIDRTLAMARGGLVHLESTPSETELPVAEVVAEDSILSTMGQSPLLRVDGQGRMEGLRDRIVWKAERVAYDQITTYRRDQVLQTGKLPRDYTRSDWRISFEPRDVSPVVEDVRFLTKLDLGKSALLLSRDDLRLDPKSPAIDRGPDLDRIPDPPAAGL
jgi:serine/threonine-protein kinase